MGERETLVPRHPATVPAGVAGLPADQSIETRVGRDLDLDWPGLQHRHPRLSTPGWSIRRPLAAWLRNEGERAFGLRILDVGCGEKPYLPFFERATSYVGVDLPGNPRADLVGPIEALPVPDDSVDVVLCTQVLEHVEDPGAAVRELHRVLVPGGRALLSTHGVMLFHPNPNDFWRWTHTGLRRLFEQEADWSDVRVEAGAGSASCLAMLAGHYVHLLAKRAHAPVLAHPAIVALNLIGWGIDAQISSLREARAGALFANLHLTAVK